MLQNAAARRPSRYKDARTVFYRAFYRWTVATTDQTATCTARPCRKTTRYSAQSWIHSRASLQSLSGRAFSVQTTKPKSADDPAPEALSEKLDAQQNLASHEPRMEVETRQPLSRRPLVRYRKVRGSSDPDASGPLRAPAKEGWQRMKATPTPLASSDELSSGPALQKKEEALADLQGSFKIAMSQVIRPATVVTTTQLRGPVPIDDDNGAYCRGATISSFNSMALEPVPVVSLCIRRGGGLHQMIQKSRTFSVQLLAPDHDGIRLAQCFSFHKGRGATFFDSLTRRDKHDVFVADNGHIQISGPGVLARIECNLRDESINIGSHIMIVGEVTGVWRTSRTIESRVEAPLRLESSMPYLAYAKRKYWKASSIESDHEEQTIVAESCNGISLKDPLAKPAAPHKQDTSREDIETRPGHPHSDEVRKSELAQGEVDTIQEDESISAMFKRMSSRDGTQFEEALDPLGRFTHLTESEERTQSKLDRILASVSDLQDEEKLPEEGEKVEPSGDRSSPSPSVPEAPIEIGNAELESLLRNAIDGAVRQRDSERTSRPISPASGQQNTSQETLTGTGTSSPSRRTAERSLPLSFRIRNFTTYSVKRQVDEPDFRHLDADQSHLPGLKANDGDLQDLEAGPVKQDSTSGDSESPPPAVRTDEYPAVLKQTAHEFLGLDNMPAGRWIIAQYIAELVYRYGSKRIALAIEGGKPDAEYGVGPGKKNNFTDARIRKLLIKLHMANRWGSVGDEVMQELLLGGLEGGVIEERLRRRKEGKGTAPRRINRGE